MDKCISTFESSVNKGIWKNCIQKYFLKISGASRVFYSISLNEGYSTVRTLALWIVSWLIFCLNLRFICRILPQIMGSVFGALCYMNRYIKFFVIECNTVVKLNQEKLLNSVAANYYFFKNFWSYYFKRVSLKKF